jgi:hypothetical protein
MSILLDEDSQRTILSLGSPLSPQQREAFLPAGGAGA